MTTEVASLEARFTANTAGFDAGIARVEGRMATAAGNIGGNLQSIGRDMSAMGTQMMFAGGLIIAPLALAMRTAINFESSFADVAKTVDATDAELATIRQTIRNMATDDSNPLSALENAHTTLAGIMATAGQLGVATDQLVPFTNTMGMLAMSTDLAAEEAATLTARFANVTGMDFSNVDEFGSSLVALGNNSAATESEILNMASRIAAAGSAAGLSEADILGMSAALTSAGVSAELGGSNFSRFLGVIASGVAEGGSELRTFATTAGTTAEDFATTWRNNPTAAVQEFLAGLGQMDQAQQLQVLSDLGLSGQEAARVLTTLAGNTDLVADSLVTANQGWGENTALMTEAEARAGTTQGALNRAGNAASDVSVSLGEALTPALNTVLDALVPMALQFSQFAEANPQLVQAALGIGLALAGVGIAAKVLGGIVAGLGSILAFGGSALTVAVAVGKGALLALGLAAGVVGWPILAVAGAVAAVVAAIIAFDIDIRPALNAAKDFIVEVFGGMAAAVTGLLSELGKIPGAIAAIPGELFQGGPTAEMMFDTGGMQVMAPGGGAPIAGVPTLVGVGPQDAGATGAYIDTVFGRAVGGAVNPNTPYMVGERGPELFVPSGGGRIMPNGSMGGRTIILNNPVFEGVEDVNDLFDRLERVAAQRG